MALLQALDLEIFRNGADEGIRTPDLLITNQLLYQLSYIGVCEAFFLHGMLQGARSFIWFHFFGRISDPSQITAVVVATAL